MGLKSADINTDIQESDNPNMLRFRLEPEHFYIPGKIYQYNLPLGDRFYNLIVSKYNQRIYALSGICPYDLGTNLGEGVIFNNKLYCPHHGDAFNIETGETEYGPC
jgi:nitrite reductase/ring-hydroxylating ferredoxin subunit